MSTLDKAILIAVINHHGRKDRTNQPEILHPLRVMFKMQTTNQKIVAILHDVIEDSNWKIDDLRKEGFSDEIIEAIKLLTRDDKTNYEEYIRRLKNNKLARKVKIADLEDRMDLSYMEEIKDQDFEKIKKYSKAIKFLKEK